MRTWLRIEFLLQQLTVHPPLPAMRMRCIFSAISAIFRCFERGEVRTDLMKELERQQRKLQSWAEVPGLIRIVSTNCVSS
jgi:cell division protein ZapD